MSRWLMGHIASDESLPQRAAKFLTFFVTGSEFMRDLSASACETGAMLARRLGFSQNIENTVRYLWEQWNGRGMAYHLKGDQTPVASRVLHLAQVMEVAHRTGGPSAATTIARDRRTRDFDPDVVDAFIQASQRPDFWSALEMESAQAAVLALAPDSPYDAVTDAHLDNTCEVLADFIDMKSPFTWGHSKAVADAAVGIAKQLRLPDTDITRLQRAALVHDLGKVTVPCSAMEKQDKFSTDERERIRLHAYYTERILSNVAPLRDLGADAAAHHEWVDGRGFHRQLRAAQTTLHQRILATADAFAISTHNHGNPVDPEAALRQMKASVATQLDPLCYEGLAGHLQGAPAPARPVFRDQRLGSLSDREIEVLRALAQGMRNRQIADSLVISPKTVERHLENIYGKLDITSRTSAVIFALQNGIVG
ncbi:MAG: HD domain-containing protein [SAR202 cluster bacterium]|nr:HD domain-containing protein [SAR202 cluster bacterium]